VEKHLFSTNMVIIDHTNASHEEEEVLLQNVFIASQVYE
jgi:hypothetical protein